MNDFRENLKTWAEKLGRDEKGRVLEALIAFLVFFSAAAVAAGQLFVAGFFLVVGAVGWAYSRCKKRDDGFCKIIHRMTDAIF